MWSDDKTRLLFIGNAFGGPLAGSGWLAQVSAQSTSRSLPVTLRDARWEAARVWRWHAGSDISYGDRWRGSARTVGMRCHLPEASPRANTG